MLSALESFFIVLLCMAAATTCLLLYRRLWLRHNRHQLNEVIGWQITFLATTYAVIVAFMLSDVWNSYRAAEANTESEANALLNLYRSSLALPAPQNHSIPALAENYASEMVTSEWPAMELGRFSPEASVITKKLWSSIAATEVQNASQATLLGQALTDLTNMTEHRRIRHLESSTGLPVIFWVLLIVGGVLTVLYTCFFDIDDSGLHAAQVLGTTFIISLTLVTIADVDAPYGGGIRIQSTAFQLALDAMHLTPHISE